MIEAYIKNKGNMNIAIKNYRLYLNKKAKSPTLLSNGISNKKNKFCKGK